MVRLKFLLFALLVLGLGLAHLPLISGPLSAHAVEGASAQAASAIAEVAREMEGRRSAVQGLALELAASRELATALQPLLGRPTKKGRGPRVLEPLTASRFDRARAPLESALHAELKSVAIYGLVAGDQAWYAKVGGSPSSDHQALNVRELARTGAQGTVAEAFGTPHFFVSVPVLWLNETVLKGATPPPRLIATLVVGAPLVVEEGLARAASSARVAALALVKGDTVMATAGPEKALVELARSQLKSGELDVVQRGEVEVFLERLRLPVLTREDDLEGGRAPLAVGVRRTLHGTSFEVVSVASVRPFMRALAEYQQNALLALGGLAGFSLLWALVMGLGLKAAQPSAPKKKKGEPESEQAEPEQAEPEQAALDPARVAKVLGRSTTRELENTTPYPTSLPREPTSDASLAAAFPFPASGSSASPQLAPPVEAEPFGAEPKSASAPQEGEPPLGAAPFADSPPTPDSLSFSSSAEPAGNASLPFESPPPVPDMAGSRGRGAYSFEDQPTAAYSLQQAANPFAAAQEGVPDIGETTRVAPIPQELLKATAVFNDTGPIRLASSQAAATPTAGGAPALTEEQHFQEVFRDFLATRERCNEPNEGLSFEKFAAKLRKNKEQLVQKYACRTVRFQVYVKEGKAALKATPVKE